jgi:predicted RND superfamily exporter protein
LIADLEARTDAIIAGREGITRVVTGMVPVFLRTQEALRDSLIESFALDYLLIGVVLVILLKGVWPALVAILPTVFPVTLVFGLLAWGGMAVDIGSMVTASVALGIGVDATIHLHAWFEKGLRQGLSREEAIAQSMAHCGPAMVQTSAIICLGLLGLMGADLVLVSRFGWLMAALVFVATLSDIVFLPTLMAGPLGKLMEARMRRSVQSATAGGSPIVSTPATSAIPRPHSLPPHGVLPVKKPQAC